jgi:hypothetical protein
VGKACAAEQRDVEERIVNLGRRTAEERLCHLLLGVANRLSGHRLRALRLPSPTAAHRRPDGPYICSRQPRPS